jgi:hypothetical protein
MRLKPQPLPTPRECPVCIYKRTDKLSVEQHNEMCSRTGERSYAGARVVCAS